MANIRRYHLSPAVPLEAVPEALRERVGPNAPPAARMMAAKSLLPADPPDLVSLLSYLGGVEDEKLRTAARESLEALPENILLPALAQKLHPEALGFCATVFLKRPKAIEAIALNLASSDEAIAYIGSNGAGRVLDIVAQNQVRVLRFAPIAEALYFNPETPTGAANRVMETAVRGGLDLSHIPGYREIVAAILGEDQGETGTERDPELSAELSEDAVSLPEGLDEDFALQALLTLGDGQEMSEALFDQLLRIASTARDDEDEILADMTEARSKRALWKLIREMTVPQKVRLALMGNATARALLIRDTKRVVAMSVVRSPGLTEKEIAGFAQNKSLGEDIIRTIAYARDWTKNYQIRMSLVTNPKCPPGKAASFLSTLRDRDLKILSKDRDIPSHISRNAKRILEQKENKLRGR